MGLKLKNQLFLPNFLPKQPNLRIYCLSSYSQYFFFIVGILMLGYCVYVWLDSSIYQSYQSQNFQKALQNKPISLSYSFAKIHLVGDENPVAGMLLGRIEIPTIGITAMILEGSEESSLQRGVGHIVGTSLPGQRGNVVLSAHRNTFFKPLHSIKPNDEIILTTLKGYNRYRVDLIRIVEPDDIDVLNDNGEDILTLITCYPFNYIGSAPQRFIVRAYNIPVTLIPNLKLE